MKASVVIPSYKRPDDLLKCLGALALQDTLAAEVLVVVRTTDFETRDALREANLPPTLALKIVDVEIGGMIAALNAGLAASQGDIVCMTDDDALPHRDWITRILQHYARDPNVAGVGGKDWVHVKGVVITETRDVVGILEPTGRVVGNHHLGHGAWREVDVLKGANMSYRACWVKPLGFDERLKGTGAQVHNELALCLPLRTMGKKLIYDPNIQVDHFPAERFDEDARSKPSVLALSNAAYNQMLTLLEHFGPEARKRVYNWYSLVGTRDTPGLVQVIRMLAKGDTNVLARWKAVRVGVKDAKQDARRDARK